MPKSKTTTNQNLVGINLLILRSGGTRRSCRWQRHVAWLTKESDEDEDDSDEGDYVDSEEDVDDSGDESGDEEEGGGNDCGDGSGDSDDSDDEDDVFADCTEEDLMKEIEATIHDAGEDSGSNKKQKL